MSEFELQTAVMRTMSEHGGKANLGDTDVLIGQRTIFPHGRADDNVLQDGNVVTLECGACIHNYTGTLARTALYGENAHIEKLHDIVEETVSNAIAAVRPGVEAGEVDEAGRSVVRNAGYDNGFNHRMGYSIGLGWNYRSGMSVRPNSRAVIEESMMLHLICFLYDLEAKCGVVTSDAIIAREEGADILSKLPRDLRKIPS